MTAQRLIFRGELDLGDGPAEAEVWRSGDTAVAFTPGGGELGVIRHLVLSLSADRRVLFDGEDADGQPIAWEATSAERTEGQWVSARITWPDATQWTQAEVLWSRNMVKVTAPGQPARELIGARAEIIGGQRWIIDGDDRILADPTRGRCGSCGG